MKEPCCSQALLYSINMGNSGFHSNQRVCLKKHTLSFLQNLVEIDPDAAELFLFETGRIMDDVQPETDDGCLCPDYNIS